MSLPKSPEAADQGAAILAALQDMTSRFQRLEARVEATEARTPRVRVATPEVKEQSARQALKDMGRGEQRSGAGSFPTDNRQQPAPTKPLYREHQMVAIRRGVTREGVGVVMCRTKLIAPDGTVLSERVEEVAKSDQAKRKASTQILEDGRELQRSYEVRPLTWGQIIERMPGGSSMRCGTKLEGGFECGARVLIGDVCASCGIGPQIIDGRRKFTRFGGWKYKVRVPGLTRVDGFYEQEIEAV